MVKNPSTNPGDPRHRASKPGSGRSPGEGNGNSLQYTCLENFKDRGAWWATLAGVANSQTGLSVDTHAHTCVSSERVRTTTAKHTFAKEMGIYLLPDDFGEFLLVLKNGPDEECLQGVPSNRRHILGGVRAGSQHLQLEHHFSRHTSVRMKMGSGCPREHPVFGGLCNSVPESIYTEYR